jgi:predicted 2-oxoglutarate/Fe(II)-dependent dioxygenase YbiX
MTIEYFETPVPHIIVRNIFNTNDLANVWKELAFLTHPDKLLSPTITQSAISPNGNTIKNNHGVFLHDKYQTPNMSDIYRSMTNVFTKQFCEEVASKHMIFKWFTELTDESFLLSYYEDNDNYLPHKDVSIYTVLINLYKEPKAFTGGDLFLGEDGYTIPLENNRMIIFPSWAVHGVTPVKFLNAKEKFSGWGRYTISNFRLYLRQ